MLAPLQMLACQSLQCSPRTICPWLSSDHCSPVLLLSGGAAGFSGYSVPDWPTCSRGGPFSFLTALWLLGVGEVIHFRQDSPRVSRDALGSKPAGPGYRAESLPVLVSSPSPVLCFPVVSGFGFLAGRFSFGQLNVPIRLIKRKSVTGTV